MKILASLLTIITSAIIWLASLYATVVLGWLGICWQCGPETADRIWLFWPLVYLIALGGAYLFSKLPEKYGGRNILLAGVVFVLLGGVLHFIS
jgi:hypothetical protein